MFTRVDLYTPIHNSLRGMLFALSRAASRVDPARDEDIDALASQVERALGFLEEHAAVEERYYLPVLRTLAPAVEATLAADHQALDRLQAEVWAAAHALEIAEPSDRPAAAARLARLVNQLTSAHLAHMNREETEGNGALWNGLADEDLLDIRGRVLGSIPPARLAEWAALATAA